MEIKTKIIQTELKGDNKEELLKDIEIDELIIESLEVQTDSGLFSGILCKILLCDFSKLKIKKLTFNCEIKTRYMVFINPNDNKKIEIIFNDRITKTEETENPTGDENYIITNFINCNVNVVKPDNKLIYDIFYNSTIKSNNRNSFIFKNLDDTADENCDRDYLLFKVNNINEKYRKKDNIVIDINYNIIENSDKLKLYENINNFMINDLNLTIEDYAYKNITIKGVIDNLNINYNIWQLLNPKATTPQMTETKIINLSTLLYKKINLSFNKSISQFKLKLNTFYSNDVILSQKTMLNVDSLMSIHYPKIDNNFYPKGEPFALYELTNKGNIKLSHNINSKTSNISIIEQYDNEGEKLKILNIEGEEKAEEAPKEEKEKDIFYAFDKFSKCLYAYGIKNKNHLLTDEEWKNIHNFYGRIKQIEYNKDVRSKNAKVQSNARRKIETKLKTAFRKSKFSYMGSNDRYYKFFIHSFYNQKQNGKTAFNELRKLTKKYNKIEDYDNELKRIADKVKVKSKIKLF